MKANLDTSVEIFYNLFEKIWEEDELPGDWKGVLRDCKNYRGVMLLSVPGTVLNRILVARMKAAVDAKLRDHQAGFRRTGHVLTTSPRNASS